MLKTTSTLVQAALLVACLLLSSFTPAAHANRSPRGGVKGNSNSNSNRVLKRDDEEPKPEKDGATKEPKPEKGDKKSSNTEPPQMGAIGTGTGGAADTAPASAPTNWVNDDGPLGPVMDGETVSDMPSSTPSSATVDVEADDTEAAQAAAQAAELNAEDDADLLLNSDSPSSMPSPAFEMVDQVQGDGTGISINAAQSASGASAVVVTTGLAAAVSVASWMAVVAAL